MKTIALIAIVLCFVQMTCVKPLYQRIPGKVECEYYGQGGEGVAYHDTDSINNGSGKLNPADGTLLNEFRMKEGVDISYTKERNIDNTIYNKVQPEMNRLYVGWTASGEWIKYDIAVEKTSEYTVTLMYTANGDGTIAIDVDGKELLKATVPTTNDPADTVAWRQWHHWNKIGIGKINLGEGSHVLMLRTVDHGNMNYDYLEFKSN